MRTKARDLNGLLPSSTDASASFGQLNEHARENLKHLDDGLFRHWCLGRNIILNWCASASGVDVLVVPHYLIATFATTHPSIPEQEAPLHPKAPPAGGSQLCARALACEKFSHVLHASRARGGVPLAPPTEHGWDCT